MINKYKIKFYILFFLFYAFNLNAQNILFDFDNAPLYTSFPISLTAGGVTANFTATGQGYSIQNANAIGFTPPGFSGRIIYPSSVYLSDIRIKFSQTLTGFSIMYACQELGCDDAATMRVTAYRNGIYVGYSNRTATFPGTWPVDTLRCTFPQGFDSVIVHYQSPPPTCQDYGVIYMADNMVITPQSVNSIANENEYSGTFMLMQNYPNPFNPSTKISYSLYRKTFVTLTISDLLGKEITGLVNSEEEPGLKTVEFNSGNLASGVYYYTLKAGGYTVTKKMLLLK